MALIELDFRSAALGYHEEVVVTLPDKAPDKPYPVLWLYHGASQDCTEWLRQTSIERYANKRGVACVMPSGSNGHGMNMVHGMKYYDMLAYELPAFIHYALPCLSDKREENFTGGASMGGNVAFKMALNFPDKFAAAGAFGGALDIVSILSGTSKDGNEKLPATFTHAFPSADEIRGTKHDLIYTAAELTKKGLCPRLWSMVGNQDFGVLQVKGACEKMKALGVDITEVYDEGTHGFDLWDRYVEPFMDWLGLEKEVRRR